MNKDLRLAGTAGISSQCLALLVAACALVACTTQEAKTDAGMGGRTGGGSGGTTGGGLGGAAGSYAVSDGVLCPVPAQPVITDFTYVPPDGGASDAAVATMYARFGDSTTFSGGEYVYPLGGSWPVTSDVSGSAWHISGMLGDYSGFGLYFDNCTRLNASAYAGISFTVSGTLGNVPAGSPGMITMGMGTLQNVIAASWLLAHPATGATPPDPAAPGRCIPAATAVNQYAQSDCADATKSVPVTTDKTTVTIHWSEFIGGKPEAHVTPSDITSIYWFFPAPAGAGTTTPTTYAADITVDDLQFVTQ